jgi:hypothetical protein
MTSRTKTLASVGAATVLVVGLVGGPVLAQSSDAPASAPVGAPDAPVGAPDAPVGDTDREARRAERRQAYVDALAEELGISSDDLRAAMETVHAEFRAERLAELESRLDERVAAGDITQAQADEILRRAEDGDLPGRGGRGWRGLRGLGGSAAGGHG